MSAMTESVKRDVIDLSSPPASSGSDPVPADEMTVGSVSAIPAEEIERITTEVVAALKTVFDPEIPVDIYELGLIYKVDLDDDYSLKIEMTLTAPGCPVAGEMPGWVEDAVGGVNGVGPVSANLVFDPPWDPSRMSDEARLELGLM